MAEIGGVTVTPVIPAEVHGFSVQVGLGPYPPDAANSHRKAMYAVLRPNTPKTRKRLRDMNREKLLGIVPLIQGAADAIARDPNGKLAEEVATVAIKVTLPLAKKAEAS